MSASDRCIGNKPGCPRVVVGSILIFASHGGGSTLQDTAIRDASGCHNRRRASRGPLQGLKDHIFLLVDNVGSTSENITQN